jgi:hypothetical protein
MEASLRRRSGQESSKLVRQLYCFHLARRQKATTILNVARHMIDLAEGFQHREAISQATL